MAAQEAATARTDASQHPSTTTTSALAVPSLFQDDEAPASGASEQVKLFIGQLPHSMGEESLRPLLDPYGTIVEITIIRDKVTGGHRGCAFCTYSTREEADAAIQALHNSRQLAANLNNLQVKYAEGETQRLEAKLFVGMVPKTATEQDLFAVFDRFGVIEELIILRQGPSNASRGCAFLKFRTRESAERAIAEVNGRFRMEGSLQPLVVKFADTERSRERKRMTQLGLMGMPGMGVPYGVGMGAFGVPGVAGALGVRAALPGFTAVAPTGTGSGSATAAATSPTGGASPASVGGIYGIYGQAPLGYGGAYMLAPSLPAQKATFPNQQEGPPGSNLFIYHLPGEYGDYDLANTFAPFGTVVSAKVFIDKATGLSKCFGFVSYDNPASAERAIASMHGFQLGNKRLKVQLKRVNQGRPY